MNNPNNPNPTVVDALAALPPFLRYRPDAQLVQLAAGTGAQLQQLVGKLDAARGLQAKQLGEWLKPILGLLYGTIEATRNDLAAYVGATTIYLLGQAEPRVAVGLHPDEAGTFTEAIVELRDAVEAWKVAPPTAEQLDAASGLLTDMLGMVDDATLDESDLAGLADEGDDDDDDELFPGIGEPDDEDDDEDDEDDEQPGDLFPGEVAHG